MWLVQVFFFLGGGTCGWCRFIFFFFWGGAGERSVVGGETTGVSNHVGGGFPPFFETPFFGVFFFFGNLCSVRGKPTGAESSFESGASLGPGGNPLPSLGGTEVVLFERRRLFFRGSCCWGAAKP